MKQSTEHVTTLIDISKLPSLPQTLIELIDLCNAKDLDLRKIGKLVARDASISARILQLANSAFIGARNKFNDIEQAVVYLGSDTIRNLAISASVHETFSNINTAGIINIASFWYHSFLTAVLAKTFSQAVNYPDPSEAYLTGLLHDIGKLLLFVSFPDRYPMILEQECCGNMLPVFEKGNLGVNHAEASSLLVSQWNLNDEVTDAVFDHHENQESAVKLGKLSRILYAANRLSNTLVLSPDHLDMSAEPLLGIDSTALPRMMEEAKDTVDRITVEMGVRAVAGPLAQMEPSKRVQADRVNLARKVQAISMIGGVVDNLLKADNLQRVVRIIEESFQILFNIRYCLLLLPDVDTGTLRIHVSTNNQHLGHDELSIPVTISPTGMFAQCLESKKILHATPVDKLAMDQLETQCLRLLEAEGLIAIPVPLEGDAQGILVIGVWESASKNIIEQQETLSLLAGQVGMRIRLERLQQRAADEQIEALRRIARQVAHEIDTPVAALQNYLNGLQKKLKKNNEFKSEFDGITTQLRQIESISTQLNDLSSTSVQRNDGDVDINQSVANVVELYRELIVPDKAITISLHLDSNLPIIKSNNAGIKQIIENLIKNGLEALNKSGTLMVSTTFNSSGQDSEGGVQITVEDDGPGTPPELADSIFTAGVTTKGAGHVGLGLAITRKLVHELGGTVSYASSRMAGSKFTVSLPLAPSR